LAVLYAFQATTPLLEVYLSRIGIDLMSEIARGDSNAVLPATIVLVAGIGVTVLTSFILAGILGFERQLTSELGLSVDLSVIKKSQTLPLSFYDQPRSFDLLRRARNGSGERCVAIISSTLRILAAGATLVSMVGVLATIHWGLALVLMPMCFLSLYLNLKWGKQRFTLSHTQTPVRRRTEYLAQLLCGAESAKEQRLFGLGGYLTSTWSRLAERLRRETIRLEWRHAGARLGVQGLAIAIATAGMLWLFRGVVHREITVGTYVAMVGAINSALGQIPNLASSISQVYESTLFTGDLFAFLDLPNEVRPGGGKSFPAPLREQITVDSLHYTYPGAAEATLRGISATIPAGKRTAIVGDNGSGKTTLAKCLLGLYPVGAGSICFDDVDMTGIDVTSLRANVTAVMQDFVRYALTLRENVGFGSIEHLNDDGVLLRAASKSGISELVDSLAAGLDTTLTNMWEGGQELSYGQWQRIAIARAMVRDAQVLVLDEPTAALDPRTEAALLERFMEVTHGRTSIVISHRLGFARDAEHILVMKQGRVVEQGSHFELLRFNGEYARMFRAQAQWYVEQSD